ncbi:MAG TPA: outer membrane protein transport protein [Gemmatimonadales bacterium]|nr:outer membrane protein transport protein [Gemmatimonadales bacterium]
MRRYQVWMAAGIFAGTALATTPSRAAAQGYGLYEHDACAMARAGTGVAAPCADGSAMFFNPAGLADVTGKVATVGGVLINTSGSFTADATGQVSNLTDGHYPAPNVYLAMPLGTSKYVVGLGLFAPYGLTTEWPTTAAGRFDGYKSKIQGIYLQPTVAMKLNDKWNFGAGFDINFMSVELDQRLDLSTQQAAPGVTFAMLGIPAGTDFGAASLSGNGTGVGYHLGVQFKASDRVSFGLRYMSRQLVKFNNATASFTQVPTGIVLPGGNPFGVPAGTPLDALVAGQFLPDSQLSNQGGSTWLRIPEQLVLGTAYKITPKLTGLFDLQWTNWAVFDTLTVKLDRAPTQQLPEDNKAVIDWRLGGEYQLNPSTVLRAGILAHKGASPDENVTPNLPEGNRTELTAGFGTRLTPMLGFDFALQYIDQADRRGRSGPPGPNDGLYAFSAYLVGASFVYRF